MPEEIVVIGRVSGSGARVFESISPASSGYVSANYAPSTSYATAASVNVSVASANEAEAIEAAQNVAAAVAQIIAKLESLNPNAIISWNGHNVSVGTLLSELRTTQFVVTDETFANGGVGEAQRGINGGPNVDKLNYKSFSSSQVDSYANPNYTDGQGVVNIILHEMAHMSNHGYIQTGLNRAYYKSENGGSDYGYNNSEYWLNNEKFAYDFQAVAADYLGLPRDQFNPQTYGWMNPATIHNDHTGM